MFKYFPPQKLKLCYRLHKWKVCMTTDLKQMLWAAMLIWCHSVTGVGGTQSWEVHPEFPSRNSKLRGLFSFLVRPQGLRVMTYETWKSLRHQHHADIFTAWMKNIRRKSLENVENMAGFRYRLGEGRKGISEVHISWIRLHCSQISEWTLNSSCRL